jgi:hypothetical protein
MPVVATFSLYRHQGKAVVIDNTRPGAAPSS